MATRSTYRAENPFAALILAHGAGAGQKSPWIVKASNAMVERGVTCVTFDFPYITAGKKVPDRAPVLEDHWRRVLEDTRRELDGTPIFIGGKSMGGRIASHIAAQGVPGISGIVFFGYPLHPPGRPDQRRDAHLPQIKEPMLFLQGSKDTFGSEQEIAELLPSLRRATLHVIPGGDHSFKVPGGAAAQQPAFDDALNAATAWMQSTLGVTPG